MKISESMIINFLALLVLVTFLILGETGCSITHSSDPGFEYPHGVQEDSSDG